MEIDLDNLVFSGLEEAQERNAERLEEADKKAQAVVADDDCGDACKSNDETGYPAGFFYLPLPQGMPTASDITVAIRKIKPIAKPDGITPEVMEAIYCPVFSSAEICPIRKAGS